MSLDDEVRRIIREELPEALRALLGSASDRRDVPRLGAPRVRVRGKPKQKRNDGPCHFPGCNLKAKRPLRMFCSEKHGGLSEKDKAKYNAAWKKAHA